VSDSTYNNGVEICSYRSLEQTYEVRTISSLSYYRIRQPSHSVTFSSWEITTKVL